ncbi:GGDEF domain-containing protein [Amorphus coralli]|uniref:GGDEF domain-containing protein n=1 Tax=Amorphus coralli TaxID=340680 RepID=UPI00037C6207|nr:diguanylate cyclase [Amorphus coralli]
MTNVATDTSLSLARAAIQEAHRRGFSVDADSFRVWFAYVSEEDPLVTGYIERLDRRGEDISRDDIDRLLMLLPAEPPMAVADGLAASGATAATPPRPAPIPKAVAEAVASVSAPAPRETAAPRARPAAVSADARPSFPRPQPSEGEPTVGRSTPFDKLSQLPNRHAFSKDVRRRWLHPDAKRGPQTLFLTSCRRPGDGSADGDELMISPMQAVMLVALTRVFEKLGPVYRYDAQTIGLILSGVNLRQTVSIAEAVRRSLETRKDLIEMQGKAKVVFASAAVSLMADEDPAKAVALADRCLATAAKSGESRVVCETDPDVQAIPDPRRSDRPIEDQYARIRALLKAR